MIAATPLMLAVIESKIRFLSLDRIASAATVKTPNTAPATIDERITVSVPRPRRLTIPVSPPM